MEETNLYCSYNCFIEIIPFLILLKRIFVKSIKARTNYYFSTDSSACMNCSRGLLHPHQYISSWRRRGEVSDVLRRLIGQTELPNDSW